MLSTRKKTKKYSSTIIIGILCFNISLLFLFGLNVPIISDQLEPTNENDFSDPLIDEIFQDFPEEIEDGINISEYEEKYQTFVESKIPDSSYDEDAGFWLKGDPSMGTSDGDVILFSQNDKSVDELAEMAINEGLDFIGITNLDKFKLYIPEYGDLELEADLGLTQGAVSNARYTYGDDLLIFYGVEKNIGTVDYFGLGQRIKCLLPYDAANELDNMNDLLTASSVADVISKMESYTGSSYFNEKGTVSFCVNEGVLGLWSFLEYQALANSQAPGGVVSVSDTEVHEFLEFDAGASSTTPNWDYYIDEGAGMLGHLGSDAYRSGSGGPGQNVKTYAKVWSKDYQNVMMAFQLGRIFTAQHDVIDGMNFYVTDNYDNIAYMGDTMVSYGEQTYKIDIENNNALQSVKLISNFANNIQIYEDFGPADFDTSQSGHTKMEITLPHSELDYYVRLEGEDYSGNRFFSSPIYYEKSAITFPELTITNPVTEEFHTNTGVFPITWDKSEDLTYTHFYVNHSYWEYNPSDLNPNTLDYHTVLGPSITTYSSYPLEDGWNTILITGEDQWGNSAKDLVYIYYHEDIPVINIFSPLNGTYLPYDTVTVNWTATASSGKTIANFTIWTDSGFGPLDILDPNTRDYTFSPGDLDEGENKISIRVYQDTNHESDVQELTIHIDTFDPLVIIDEPTNGVMYDENSPQVIMNFTGSDPIGTGKVNRYELDIYKNSELSISTTLPADAINYTLPMSDGEFYVNITIFDEAGNKDSKGLTYYVDYYRPKLNLPKIFYTQSSPYAVNWTLDDTATWIDTIKLTFNGSTQIISNNSLGYMFTESDFVDEGIYDFTLTVNDSVGHEISRESKVIVDKTYPIIYTMWIEDKYFQTSYSASYFRIGITMKDSLSNIKDVSLFYSIYTDPNDKLSGQIQKFTNGLSKLVVEIPQTAISSKMTSALSLNISFYFKVQNNVDLVVTTQSIEYTISFDKQGIDDRLTGGQIAMILSITVGSTVLIGYSVFKIKRRREYGSLAKYY